MPEALLDVHRPAVGWETSKSGSPVNAPEIVTDNLVLTLGSVTKSATRLPDPPLSVVDPPAAGKKLPTLAVPVAVPLVAVINAVPLPTMVMLPLLDTVAVAVLDDA